ncbi:neuronal acetylcholine receptor subunit beta-4-like [Saccostrea echinata]|uniref:neuronal acetylcholine receptor subunit beta-4-like n=1 Tax=Saccostrea echinata TaxID=191078 RepID=UPI002A817F64|nr:neuronal acetylcholine receptor subunit beta-4-like [Saccostrea echinata]
MISWRTAIIILLFVPTSFCADARLLEKRLLSNYSTIVKPRRDQTQSVLVNLTFTMNSLRTVEERYQYITFMGWFIVTWYDDFLSWDEKEFVGLRSVNIPYTKVWVPDISLYFSETNTHDLGVNPFVSVYSSGLVVWYPGDQYTIECLLDIQKFPFDKQSCELRIAAWQTTDWMQKLFPKRRFNEMKQISENGEWEFIKTDLKSVFVREFNMTEVRYTIFLRRRPLYAMMSTVFPVVLLAILSSLSYGLPVTSGERMTYCLTVLLAFTVFLTLFEENMPRKSTNIPYLSLYLCIHLISSVFSIFVSVIVIRSHHIMIKKLEIFTVQKEVVIRQDYENKAFQNSPEKNKSSKDHPHDKNFNMETKSTEENKYKPDVKDDVDDKEQTSEKEIFDDMLDDGNRTLPSCCDQMLGQKFVSRSLDKLMLKISVAFTLLSTVGLGLLFYL